MTINDLSVSFNYLDRNSLLGEWAWLVGAQLPVLITKAGDAFLQDSETGNVNFLDTVEGTLELVANNGEQFEQLLTQADFVMKYFSVNLIAPLMKRGSIPDGHLYSWKKAPVLGGEYNRSNLEATDIKVHFSILGQIWRQVNDLPEGTEISDVEFVNE